MLKKLILRNPTVCGAAIALAGAGVLALAGCGNADMAHFSAMGHPGHIRCWSGTLLLIDDYSVGKIQNSSQSDGYSYASRSTGKLREVSGACVIDVQ